MGCCLVTNAVTTPKCLPCRICTRFCSLMTRRLNANGPSETGPTPCTHEGQSRLRSPWVGFRYYRLIPNTNVIGESHQKQAETNRNPVETSTGYNNLNDVICLFFVIIIMPFSATPLWRPLSSAAIIKRSHYQALPLSGASIIRRFHYQALPLSGASLLGAAIIRRCWAA